MGMLRAKLASLFPDDPSLYCSRRFVEGIDAHLTPNRCILVLPLVQDSRDDYIKGTELGRGFKKDGIEVLVQP